MRQTAPEALSSSFVPLVAAHLRPAPRLAPAFIRGQRLRTFVLPHESLLHRGTAAPWQIQRRIVNSQYATVSWAVANIRTCSCA